MGLLDQLMGGGQPQDDYRDFISRFDKGAPWDGISDDEAADRYRQVAPELSDDQYRQSAEDAFARLSPQEREEFGRWLEQRSGGRAGGMGSGGRARYDDPHQLAEITNQVRKDDPNILEQVLGKGGSGGAFDNPIAKAAFAGIAAMAAQRIMGGRR